MPNHHQANPPKTPRKEDFPGRDEKTERCPDCEENSSVVQSTADAPLDLLGKSRFDRSRGIPRTIGCETCGGTGRVPKGWRGDEYELPEGRISPYKERG